MVREKANGEPARVKPATTITILFYYLQTYQGARNLMNTVFPAVSSSKLSGVSSTALAVPAKRPSKAKTADFMVRNLFIDFMEDLSLLLWLAMPVLMMRTALPKMPHQAMRVIHSFTTERAGS